MPRSPRTSPRTRSPRRNVGIAELVPQRNRTRFVVYALDGTRAHDRFLDRVFRRVPRTGLTRAAIKRVVAEEGGGRYTVRYNSIHLADAEAVRRRLFA